MCRRSRTRLASTRASAQALAGVCWVWRRVLRDAPAQLGLLMPPLSIEGGRYLSESVISMNNWQKRRFAMKIVSSMFNTVSGKKLAVLGFAYKKNTSDIRNTVAIDICKALIAEKAQLSVHDPRVSSEAINMAFTGDDGSEKCVAIEPDPYLACAGAHAVIILTEWDSFARLDFERVYEGMQRPAFVFDGRNLLDHEQLREIGFNVYGIGKPPPTVTKPVDPPCPSRWRLPCWRRRRRRSRRRLRGSRLVPRGVTSRPLAVGGDVALDGGGGRRSVGGGRLAAGYERWRVAATRQPRRGWRLLARWQVLRAYCRACVRVE